MKVIVIGGGSAGCGAAYRAALAGAQVTIVETGPVLGGTSTLGGVHCWEPGIASFGLNRAVYENMRRIPGAASVGRTLHPYDPESHIGLNGILPEEPYESSLRRGTLTDQRTARVHFEPQAMAWTMDRLLRSNGVHILTSTAFLNAEADGGRVACANVCDLTTGETYALRANAFIDCTADAVVCRSLNVETMFGEDSFSRFEEPCAPEKATGIVNGISLCFRVALGQCENEVPEWAKTRRAQNWLEDSAPPCSSVNYYPNGDLNFNPLPLMQGAEYFALPPQERIKALVERVYLYWDWMKRVHGHHQWHIVQIMPRAGVRESWRVVTREIMTENDLRQGYSRQGNDIIALGDHVMDTHGERSGNELLSRYLSEPYGIRMGSLIVPDFENLLVAGRCAGLSHLAASSCRLSRTMMDMGEAAGALAVQTGDLRAASPEKVRQLLDFERYLEWVKARYYCIGEER